MDTSSGRDETASMQKLSFAVGSLKSGGGGIAELSRQVVATLVQMQREERLQFELHVLDDASPGECDRLFDGPDNPPVRWYAGSRWKFALGLLFSRADIVLYDHVGLARIQGLLPVALARPYLLLIHSIEIWNNTRSDYYRSARKACLLIANSEYTAHKARLHYPDLPEIVVCWPGKDPVKSACAGQATGCEGLGPHAMLIVGRLDAAQRHKGHDQLIETMPLVLDRVPDAQLVIAGGGGDRGRLEHKASDLGVADRVLFTGRVDDAQLQDLYSHCALFVMPSDGDGFGLVFLEAMMHRMACVGLQDGAAAEIFENGKHGVLVDRDDSAGMAEQLSALLLDDDMRRRLGETGFDRYRSVFRARHHSRRLRSVLNDYINQ